MRSKDGKPIYQPNKQRDIKGQKFGKLTAIEFAYRDKNHSHYWKFRCDCGNEIVVRKNSVTSGNTTQCKQCSNNDKKERATTHGMAKTRLYKEWAGIIQRCENPRSTSYDRYGKQGISVCEEWHDFEVFKTWAMENGYTDNLTIDRIDSKGNYEPLNCRWVDVITQNNNQKTNVTFEHNGETHTLSEWARLYGMNYQCFYARWKKNKNPEYLFKGYTRKKMSNADVIRNMTDEELAEFLEGFTICDHCEYYKNERCTLDNPCVHGFAQAMAQEWLQTEVDGDTK